MSGGGPEFQGLLEGFFNDWLRGRKVSPHTVSSYSDSFRMLLLWASSELGVTPMEFGLDHLTQANVLSFLGWLEAARGNSPKTCNCRLAAVKSFCEYASYRAPDRLGQLKAVRRIPKRTERVKEIDYLTPGEVAWMADTCPEGSEQRLMVLVLYNTGCRISEVLGLRSRDVAGPYGGRLHVSVLGKGRKERTLPLWEDVSEALSDHIGRACPSPDDHVFTGRDGRALTRSGARHRIDAAYARARLEHPELAAKHVTPHVFRHSCAMAMLAAGVDIGTVAIWLGHEDVNTTHKYVVSDMGLKEEALEKVRRDWREHRREPYKASDDILEFLGSL